MGSGHAAHACVSTGLSRSLSSFVFIKKNHKTEVEMLLLKEESSDVSVDARVGGFMRPTRYRIFLPTLKVWKCFIR
jgi:hypothetical protein